MPFYKSQIGFTLAEVLITLLIIGIIASTVIPNLIQDTQNAELKTAWKKTYSELNQATKRILLDRGGSMKGMSITNDQFRNLYLQYLSNFKLCPQPVIGPCWSNTTHSLGYDDLINDDSGIILGNGTFVLFDYDDPNCNYDGKQICGYLDVDVNGLKGPNKIGKDIFAIKVLENRILPYGTLGDDFENTCNTSGVSCSAEYLK